MTDHPLTPPPELFRQWEGMPRSLAFEAAYRAGADQELEACCEWLEDADLDDSQKVSWVNLRTARRPKPPSLKERALQAWAAVESSTDDQTAMAVIRRALEALPE